MKINMKIKESKKEEFIKLFNEKIKSDKRYSEDDKFYYYDENNDCFAINKNDYSISLTGNSGRDIQYYVIKLNIDDFIKIENEGK